MRITSLRVSNFRGLKKCAFELDSLTAVVGPNNAGKSSVLLALKLFFSRTKLGIDQFHDPSLPVRIEVSFDGVSEVDFARIVEEEHRERVRNLVDGGRVSFVLQYLPGEKGELLCRKQLPVDPRFSDASITAAIAGKKGAAQIHAALSALLPEFEADLVGLPTHSAAKAAVDAIIASLPDTAKVESDAPLPVGIPASLTGFFPEPILIPAVRDVRDELKTSEASTFGKLVGVILGLIEQNEQMQRIAESLETLHQLLNRTHGEDGAILDNRLGEVRSIEAALARILRESFPRIDLHLEVPRPELRSIFSSAKLTLDDGVRGDVETKGDGLKRSVIFALLRTYVEMSRQGRAAEQAAGNEPEYLFLFEEPELYLYPAAQRTLFNALNRISARHQVVLTTHSPIFLSPNGPRSFVKLSKRSDASGRSATHAKAMSSLSDLSHKDAFQLICYENNAAGFFSDKVVLLEGDADLIFFDHAFRRIAGEQSPEEHGVVFLRINGKGNVRRYRDFLERFDVEVHCILDRDILLDGFEHLAGAEHLRQQRERFLNELDEAVRDEGLTFQIGGDTIRDMVRGYSWRERYDRLKVLTRELRAGRSLAAAELDELELLFEAEATQVRRQALDSFTDAQARVPTMFALIQALYEHRTYVLTRGAVEKYYRSGGTARRDKPEKALAACSAFTCAADYRDADRPDDECEIEGIVKAIIASPRAEDMSLAEEGELA